MHDIGHGNNMPTLVFTNLRPNELYRAQVLASSNETGTARRSSYELISGDLVTGTVVDSVANLDLTTLHGPALTQGVVITLMGFSDASGTLSFRAPNGTTGADNNSIASAFILTQVPEPSTAVLGLAGLGILLRRRRA